MCGHALHRLLQMLRSHAVCQHAQSGADVGAICAISVVVTIHTPSLNHQYLWALVAVGLEMLSTASTVNVVMTTR